MPNGGGDSLHPFATATDFPRTKDDGKCSPPNHEWYKYGCMAAMASSFMDVDGDGLLDAFVSIMGGNVRYYRNVGNSTHAKFTGNGGKNSTGRATAFGPLPNVQGTLELVDMDNDGGRGPSSSPLP